MAETVEIPRAAADAESLAEHKQIRKAERNGTPLTASVSPQVAEKPKPAEAPKPVTSVEPGVSETPSASAGASEAPPTQAPKRDDAEARIKQLLADRAERDRRIQELESRVSKPAAAPVPKPAEVNSDPEPDLDDYVKKAPVDETFQKTLQRFTRDQISWTQRKEQASTAQTAMQKRIADRIAQTGKADFEEVTAPGGTPIWKGLAPAAVFAMRDEFDNGMAVLYQICANPAELKRIQSLSPARQVAEIAKLSDSLSKPESASQPAVVTRPAATPISRIPPPGRPVGGTQPAPAKSTAEASSLAEHKALRAARRN